MYIENDPRIAEMIREQRFTKKDQLIKWLDEEKVRIEEKSKTDKQLSAAYYYAYLSLLQKLRQKINGTVLFENLEDYWYYSMSITSSGASLDINWAYGCEIHGDKKLVVKTGQTLTLLHVPAQYLTVSEYAHDYGVDPGTVRQWIRRGKIRSAKKVGTIWLIPEMTAPPSRGYLPARYAINEELSDIPEEFSFLSGCQKVSIYDRHGETGAYTVYCTDKNLHTNEVIVDTPKRERLEVYLISHPDVEYINGPGDGVLASKTSDSFGQMWEF